jgi:hypothetical chaperone protein
MSVKVGIDFGTSNSGVALYDGQRVQLLPVDPKNVLPEVIKTVLYITRDYRPTIGRRLWRITTATTSTASAAS